MKNYTLSPTDENILDTLMYDRIGRNNDVKCFINLIEQIQGACSIAINAPWGSGKTFFIKQVQLVLDYNNHIGSVKFSEDAALKINQAIGSDFLCSNSYVTAYYDAWENDNAHDPVLSIIHSIIKSNGVMDTMGGGEINTLLSEISGFFTKANPLKTANAVKESNLFHEIRKQKAAKTLVSNLLDELVLEKGNQLIVFVDELDRCKPSFAIEVLERIKHYFEKDSIVFVFAVNLMEMRHTVAACYGSDFSADRYLDKFFDLRVNLPQIDLDRYIDMRICEYEKGLVMFNVAKDVCSYFNFSIREVDRYLSAIKIVAGGYRKNQMGSYTHSGKEYDFFFSYFVPYALGLGIDNFNAYHRFVTGRSLETAVDFLHLIKDKYNLSRITLNDDEKFEDSTNCNDDAANCVSLGKRVQEIYDIIFGNTLSSNDYNPAYIAGMSFDKHLVTKCKETLTFLSQYCDYNN